MKYCENCGAKHGESDKEKMVRTRMIGDSSQDDVIYRVDTTDRGDLCQFCQEHPNATRLYSPTTGGAVPS